MKQGNRVPGASYSVVLGPTTQLNGERNSKLGELEHMTEAEFIRDIHTAASALETSLKKKRGVYSFITRMDILVRIFKSAL